MNQQISDLSDATDDEDENMPNAINKNRVLSIKYDNAKPSNNVVNHLKQSEPERFGNITSKLPTSMIFQNKESKHHDLTGTVPELTMNEQLLVTLSNDQNRFNDSFLDFSQTSSRNQLKLESKFDSFANQTKEQNSKIINFFSMGISMVIKNKTLTCFY